MKFFTLLTHVFVGVAFAAPLSNVVKESGGQDESDVAQGVTISKDGQVTQTGTGLSGTAASHDAKNDASDFGNTKPAVRPGTVNEAGGIDGSSNGAGPASAAGSNLGPVENLRRGADPSSAATEQLSDFATTMAGNLADGTRKIFGLGIENNAKVDDIVKGLMGASLTEAVPSLALAKPAAAAQSGDIDQLYRRDDDAEETVTSESLTDSAGSSDGEGDDDRLEDIVNSSSLIDSAAEGDLSGLDRRDDFMEDTVTSERLTDTAEEESDPNGVYRRDDFMEDTVTSERLTDTAQEETDPNGVYRRDDFMEDTVTSERLTDTAQEESDPSGAYRRQNDDDSEDDAANAAGLGQGAKDIFGLGADSNKKVDSILNNLEHAGLTDDGLATVTGAKGPINTEQEMKPDQEVGPGQQVNPEQEPTPDQQMNPDDQTNPDEEMDPDQGKEKVDQKDSDEESDPERAPNNPVEDTKERRANAPGGEPVAAGLIGPDASVFGDGRKMYGMGDAINGQVDAIVAGLQKAGLVEAIPALSMKGGMAADKGLSKRQLMDIVHGILEYTKETAASATAKAKVAGDRDQTYGFNSTDKAKPLRRPKGPSRLHPAE